MTITCPNCGATDQEVGKFCENCGFFIDSADAKAPSPLPPDPNRITHAHNRRRAAINTSPL